MAIQVVEFILAKLRNIKPKKSSPPPPASEDADRSSNDLLASLLRDIEQRSDFLGPAAIAGKNAATAVKAGEYDKAWAFYQEQKTLYMQHANQYGMTKKQAIALDASLHLSMANVLRLEGRHHDALAHAVYCLKGMGSGSGKSRWQKLSAYFNRCKLANTPLSEVISYAEESSGLASFRSVQVTVNKWIAKG